jgi:hypothetical protein
MKLRLEQIQMTTGIHGSKYILGLDAYGQVWEYRYLDVNPRTGLWHHLSMDVALDSVKYVEGSRNDD